MSKNTLKLLEKIEEHFQAFHKVSLARSKLGATIAWRTTMIIRVSTIGVLLLAPVLFYLIFTLTMNMKDIRSYMIEMAQNMDVMQQSFRIVSAKVIDMDEAVKQMDRDIQTIPDMALAVSGMNKNMLSIQENMNNVQSYMGAMRNDMVLLSEDIAVMHAAFVFVNARLQVINADVHQFTKPLTFIPFFR
jgi:methyl-accepting chemotaxis protein